MYDIVALKGYRINDGHAGAGTAIFASMNETAIRIAPLLPRGLAFMLDGFILTVLNISISSMIGDIAISKTETVAVLLVTTASYHVGFLATLSATPGKAAFRLYVGDSQGRKIRPDTAMLRYLLLFVGQLATLDDIFFWAFTAFLAVNAVLAVIDRQHRAIHDRLAQTLVLVGRPASYNSEYDPVTGERRL